jgi:nitroreductase
MDFEKTVKQRSSIRQFKKVPVPPKIVRQAIELAKLAPSAGNLQAYKVVITKEKIGNVDAPLYLVICADSKKSASRYGDRGKNLYAIQDATIFAAYLQLALVNHGLASCWVGAFSEGRLKTQLKIPDNLKPIAIISVGYPAVQKSVRNRRSYKEIVLDQ